MHLTRNDLTEGVRREVISLLNARLADARMSTNTSI